MLDVLKVKLKAREKKLVTSARLAAEAGVTLSTIHYYTTLGLLKTHRRQGNKRLYDIEAARESLRKIHHLRAEGYSLAMIRKRMGR